MEAKLKFKYDREAHILHIDKCPPYGEQESEEPPDEIIARLNPKTGEVENLEVLFFSTRPLSGRTCSSCWSVPICASWARVAPNQGMRPPGHKTRRG